MTDEFIARHRRVRGRDFGANDIAAAALPLLSHLRNQYQGIHSIILNTGDGIHVASIGFNSSSAPTRRISTRPPPSGRSTWRPSRARMPTDERFAT